MRLKIKRFLEIQRAYVKEVVIHKVIVIIIRSLGYRSIASLGLLNRYA